MNTKVPKDSLWRGDNAPTPLNPPDVFVSKDSPRIHLLGTLQELSATIGFARSLLVIANLSDLNNMLRDIQRHLYILKCGIASAREDEVINGIRIPNMDGSEVQAIDENVGRLELRLGIKPDRFIVECGAPAATALFLANEVARRAERLFVSTMNSLSLDEGVLDSHLAMGQRYLNHLSYQLYLMARVTNRSLGIPEESFLTDHATGSVSVKTETT
jgi:ATP:cob(I)alamin adenosyltransferase